jgi:hypothetical protein
MRAIRDFETEDFTDLCYYVSFNSWVTLGERNGIMVFSKNTTFESNGKEHPETFDSTPIPWEF